MIPGIVASQFTGQSEGSGLTALLDFNFLTESYEVNGSPVAAEDFLTTPGNVGVSGLNIPLLGSPNVILGDAATILLSANWTVVIEFEALATSGNMDLFCLAETPTSGFRDLFRCGYPSSPFQWWAQDDDENFTPRPCVVGTLSTGIHKMAVTRTNSKLIVAVDGEASLADTSSKTLDEIDTATFGGPAEASNGRAANIRTFVVYPEQTDEVLVELSLP